MDGAEIWVKCIIDSGCGKYKVPDIETAWSILGTKLGPVLLE
jgi:hypothetical protein